MTEIPFILDGEPVPKARPRFANGRTYTPPKTAVYERAIAVAAKIELAGREMPTGPEPFLMVSVKGIAE